MLDSRPSKYDSDRELTAFAEAVGNFNDVAAQSQGEAGEVDAGPGVFDFESQRIEPPAEAEAEREPVSASAGAVVPVLGMRMAVDEVDLGYARLIKAAALEDVPREVRGASENVFAAVDSDAGPHAPAAASERLSRVVSTLRLMKPGGVGLGAYGWSREATTWKRFSTGAGSPRPGGYELSAEEAGELTLLSERIAGRSARTPAFAWALSRFDLGAERPNQVEALSDYLLAVRALLEGGGPAKAGLSARVGALCAGAAEREEVRKAFEHALALERKVMSGEHIPRSDRSPVKAIGAVEGTLRNLLHGMATGELGSDLRVTADEILLADGLRTGGAASEILGGTAEWRVHDNEETAEWRIHDLAEAERVVADEAKFTANFDPPTPTDEQASTPHTPDLFGSRGGLDVDGVEASFMEREDSHKHGSPSPPPWLEDKAERQLEWPSFAGPRPAGRKRRIDKNERIEYLFPKAELDWTLREPSEKRRRRSA